MYNPTISKDLRARQRASGSDVQRLEADAHRLKTGGSAKDAQRVAS